MPYTLSRAGNLTVDRGDQRIVINIKAINVWVMLLAKTPSQVVKIDRLSSTSSSPAKGRRPGYVNRWKEICTQLELMPRATDTKKPNKRRNIKKLQDREKFKLLTEAEGSGLVTVLASDKNGLIRQLQLAAAEYEAGNKDLLSVITAGVKEAKRLNIPKAKLSFLKNIPQTFNWI